MKLAETLLFTRSNEWVDIKNDYYAYLGISDYVAKYIFKECNYIWLPEIKQEFKVGETIANIECSTSDGCIYAPFDCIIEEINIALLKTPNEIINKPYETWILKLKCTGSLETLITYEEYQIEINS